MKKHILLSLIAGSALIFASPIVLAAKATLTDQEEKDVSTSSSDSTTQKMSHEAQQIRDDTAKLRQEAEQIRNDTKKISKEVEEIGDDAEKMSKEAQKISHEAEKMKHGTAEKVKKVKYMHEGRPSPHVTPDAQTPTDDMQSEAIKSQAIKSSAKGQ